MFQALQLSPTAYVHTGAQVLDVKDFGAVGNGVADDAPALRAACAAAIAAGKGLFFSAGTYLVNSVNADLNVVTLTAGIAIRAELGTAAIKVGAAITRWNHIFGQTDHSPVDLSGLDVSGLVFDGNSSANPVDVTNAGNCHRNAIGAYAGENLRVHDNDFIDWDGMNAVTLDGGVNGMGDVWVYNNRFRNIGGAYYHDMSVVYVDARRVVGYGNHATAILFGPTTPSNAVAPWEIHGGLIDWHDNHSENFQKGGLAVSPSTTSPNRPSHGLRWHHNSAVNVATGVELWPSDDAGTTDVQITDNWWTINVDLWPAVAAGGFPAYLHRGIALIGGYSTVARLRIENNDVVYIDFVGAVSPDDAAVWWVRPSTVAHAADVDVTIKRNRFTDVPSSGIMVRQFYGLERWDVSDNTFHNVGVGGLGANYQAGMLVQNRTQHGGIPIKDLRFNRNEFIDDQVAHTLSNPLRLAAGTVNIRAGCVTTNGSAVVADTNAVPGDLGAVVTGAGIPANTVVGIVNPGVGFTMSNAATASATVSLTLTGNVAATANVQALDTTMRIGDGTAVPIASWQAGQSVFDGEAWAMELMLLHTPVAASGAGWVIASDSGQRMGGYLTNAAIAPAQNDSADFDAPRISPGEWSFEVHGFKRPTSGKLTLQIDDGAGTFTTVAIGEFYAAADAYNSLVTMSGTVPAATGAHRRWRLLVATKHASSSGYTLYVTHLRGWRTS